MRFPLELEADERHEARHVLCQAHLTPSHMAHERARKSTRAHTTHTQHTHNETEKNVKAPVARFQELMLGKQQDS